MILQIMTSAEEVAFDVKLEGREYAIHQVEPEQTEQPALLVMKLTLPPFWPFSLLTGGVLALSRQATVPAHPLVTHRPPSLLQTH